MSENGYEQIGARENRLFIRPLFAGFAILIFFAGVFYLKLVDHSGFLIFSIGVVCILIGMGIITDQRNSLKKHTKSWVWVIFGVEVILASGYQLLAGSNPSLQTMNGRVQGMVSGAVIGSIGPLLLIFHFLNYYFRKKTCTQEVQAVCINLQQRWSYRSRGGSVRFIPIYEFTFGGNKLRIAGSSRKQIKVTTTGSSGREVRYYNVPKIGKQTMNGRVQGMVSGAVIGSIGPLLLIFHFLNYYFRKKTCTQEVQAVCINLQQRWSYRSRGGSVRFIPIYEFTFGGNKLRIAGSSRKQIKVTTTGSSGREVRYYNVPKIGKQYDLMINPDDPAEFYLKKDMPCISVWVIAFVAIAIGYLLFKSTVR